MQRGKPTCRIEALAVVVLLAASSIACSHTPPPRIQAAIATVNRYLPEYVEEANRALERCGGEDRARLQGTGERIVVVLDALERWAGTPEGKADGPDGPDGQRDSRAEESEKENR
jgi:hypothetical protein